MILSFDNHLIYPPFSADAQGPQSLLHKSLFLSLETTMSLASAVQLPELSENDRKRGASEAVAGDTSDAPSVPASHENNHNNLELSHISTGSRPKVYHTGWRLHALTAGYVFICNPPPAESWLSISTSRQGCGYYVAGRLTYCSLDHAASV